jgi:drug/metabolite transporter (DMT)-like permease
VTATNPWTVGHPTIGNPTMGRTEWLLVVALSVLWGGSFFFVGVVVKELPPFTIVLCRIGLAAMALLLYVRVSVGAMPVAPKLWGTFVLMGFVNALLPYSLIAWGQQHVDSGLASILVSTTPIFTVVLAHVLTRDERLTVSRVIGVVLGLAGVILLIGPEALRGLGRHGLGQLAVLGGALSYACAGIYGRRLKHLPSVVAAAGTSTCTALLLLPLTLVWDRPWALRPSVIVIGAMLGLALLSTALGYLLFFRILASAGATNVMLVNFLVPVSALLLGTLILGERPDWTVFAGMATIFIGLITIDGRVSARGGRWFSRSRVAVSNSGR